MQTPQTHPDAALDQARQMFRAVLAPWASELMELRRRGLDRPGFRLGRGLVLRPTAIDERPAGPGLRLPTREAWERARRRAA